MEIISQDVKNDIIRLAFPDQAVSATVFDPLLPFFEPISSDKPRKGGEGFGYITLPEDIGDVTITSKKLANVRFNLRDAVFKAVPEVVLGVKAALSFAAQGQEIYIAFLCLKLLQVVQDLMTVKLDSADATILVELLRFSHEEHIIRTDEFLDYMEHISQKHKIPFEKLTSSFARLEQLHTIRQLEGEIILAETIVIKGAS